MNLLAFLVLLVAGAAGVDVAFDIRFHHYSGVFAGVDGIMSHSLEPFLNVSVGEIMPVTLLVINSDRQYDPSNNPVPDGMYIRAYASNPGVVLENSIAAVSAASGIAVFTNLKAVTCVADLIAIEFVVDHHATAGASGKQVVSPWISVVDPSTSTLDFKAYFDTHTVVTTNGSYLPPLHLQAVDFCGRPIVGVENNTNRAKFFAEANLVVTVNNPDFYLATPVSITSPHTLIDSVLTVGKAFNPTQLILHSYSKNSSYAGSGAAFSEKFPLLISPPITIEQQDALLFGDIGDPIQLSTGSVTAVQIPILNASFLPALSTQYYVTLESHEIELSSGLSVVIFGGFATFSSVTVKACHQPKATITAKLWSTSNELIDMKHYSSSVTGQPMHAVRYRPFRSGFSNGAQNVFKLSGGIPLPPIAVEVIDSCGNVDVTSNTSGVTVEAKSETFGVSGTLSAQVINGTAVFPAIMPVEGRMYFEAHSIGTKSLHNYRLDGPRIVFRDFKSAHLRFLSTSYLREKVVENQNPIVVRVGQLLPPIRVAVASSRSTTLLTSSSTPVTASLRGGTLAHFTAKVVNGVATFDKLQITKPSCETDANIDFYFEDTLEGEQLHQLKSQPIQFAKQVDAIEPAGSTPRVLYNNDTDVGPSLVFHLKDECDMLFQEPVEVSLNFSRSEAPFSEHHIETKNSSGGIVSFNNIQLPWASSGILHITTIPSTTQSRTFNTHIRVQSHPTQKIPFEVRPIVHQAVRNFSHQVTSLSLVHGQSIPRVRFTKSGSASSDQVQCVRVKSSDLSAVQLLSSSFCEDDQTPRVVSCGVLKHSTKIEFCEMDYSSCVWFKISSMSPRRLSEQSELRFSSPERSVFTVPNQRVAVAPDTAFAAVELTVHDSCGRQISGYGHVSSTIVKRTVENDVWPVAEVQVSHKGLAVFPALKIPASFSGEHKVTFQLIVGNTITDQVHVTIFARTFFDNFPFASSFQMTRQSILGSQLHSVYLNEPVGFQVHLQLTDPRGTVLSSSSSAAESTVILLRPKESKKQGCISGDYTTIKDGMAVFTDVRFHCCAHRLELVATSPSSLVSASTWFQVVAPRKMLKVLVSPSNEPILYSEGISIITMQIVDECGEAVTSVPPVSVSIICFGTRIETTLLAGQGSAPFAFKAGTVFSASLIDMEFQFAPQSQIAWDQATGSVPLHTITMKVRVMSQPTGSAGLMPLLAPYVTGLQPDSAGSLPPVDLHVIGSGFVHDTTANVHIAATSSSLALGGILVNQTTSGYGILENVTVAGCNCHESKINFGLRSGIGAGRYESLVILPSPECRQNVRLELDPSTSSSPIVSNRNGHPVARGRSLGQLGFIVTDECGRKQSFLDDVASVTFDTTNLFFEGNRQRPLSGAKARFSDLKLADYSQAVGSVTFYCVNTSTGKRLDFVSPFTIDNIHSLKFNLHLEQAPSIVFRDQAMRPPPTVSLRDSNFNLVTSLQDVVVTVELRTGNSLSTTTAVIRSGQNGVSFTQLIVNECTPESKTTLSFSVATNLTDFGVKTVRKDIELMGSPHFSLKTDKKFLSVIDASLTAEPHSLFFVDSCGARDFGIASFTAQAVDTYLNQATVLPPSTNVIAIGTELKGSASSILPTEFSYQKLTPSNKGSRPTMAYLVPLFPLRKLVAWRGAMIASGRQTAPLQPALHFRETIATPIHLGTVENLDWNKLVTSDLPFNVTVTSPDVVLEMNSVAVQNGIATFSSLFVYSCPQNAKMFPTNIDLVFHTTAGGHSSLSGLRYRVQAAFFSKPHTSLQLVGDTTHFATKANTALPQFCIESIDSCGVRDQSTELVAVSVVESQSMTPTSTFLTEQRLINGLACFHNLVVATASGNKSFIEISSEKYHHSLQIPVQTTLENRDAMSFKLLSAPSIVELNKPFFIELELLGSDLRRSTGVSNVPLSITVTSARSNESTHLFGSVKVGFLRMEVMSPFCGRVQIKVTPSPQAAPQIPYLMNRHLSHFITVRSYMPSRIAFCNTPWNFEHGISTLQFAQRLPPFCLRLVDECDATFPIGPSEVVSVSTNSISTGVRFSVGADTMFFLPGVDHHAWLPSQQFAQVDNTVTSASLQLVAKYANGNGLELTARTPFFNVSIDAPYTPFMMLQVSAEAPANFLPVMSPTDTDLPVLVHHPEGTHLSPPLVVDLVGERGRRLGSTVSSKPLVVEARIQNKVIGTADLLNNVASFSVLHFDCPSVNHAHIMRLVLKERDTGAILTEGETDKVYLQRNFPFRLATQILNNNTYLQNGKILPLLKVTAYDSCDVICRECDGSVVHLDATLSTPDGRTPYSFNEFYSGPQSLELRNGEATFSNMTIQYSGKLEFVVHTQRLDRRISHTVPSLTVYQAPTRFSTFRLEPNTPNSCSTSQLIVTDAIPILCAFKLVVLDSNGFVESAPSDVQSSVEVTSETAPIRVNGDLAVKSGVLHIPSGSITVLCTNHPEPKLNFILRTTSQVPAKDFTISVSLQVVGRPAHQIKFTSTEGVSMFMPHLLQVWSSRIEERKNVQIDLVDSCGKIQTNHLPLRCYLRAVDPATNLPINVSISNSSFQSGICDIVLFARTPVNDVQLTFYAESNVYDVLNNAALHAKWSVVVNYYSLRFSQASVFQQASTSSTNFVVDSLPATITKNLQVPEVMLLSSNGTVNDALEGYAANVSASDGLQLTGFQSVLSRGYLRFPLLKIAACSAKMSSILTFRLISPSNVRASQTPITASITITRRHFSTMFFARTNGLVKQNGVKITAQPFELLPSVQIIVLDSCGKLDTELIGGRILASDGSLALVFAGAATFTALRAPHSGSFVFRFTPVNSSSNGGSPTASEIFFTVEVTQTGVTPVPGATGTPTPSAQVRQVVERYSGNFIINGLLWSSALGTVQGSTQLEAAIRADIAAAVGVPADQVLLIGLRLNGEVEFQITNVTLASAPVVHKRLQLLMGGSSSSWLAATTTSYRQITQDAGTLQSSSLQQLPLYETSATIEIVDVGPVALQWPASFTDVLRSTLRPDIALLMDRMSIGTRTSPHEISIRSVVPIPNSPRRRFLVSIGIYGSSSTSVLTRQLSLYDQMKPSIALPSTTDLMQKQKIGVSAHATTVGNSTHFDPFELKGQTKGQCKEGCRTFLALGATCFLLILVNIIMMGIASCISIQ